jgi:hypothetical protein
MKWIERVLLISVFVGPIGFYVVQRAGFLEPGPSPPIATNESSVLAGEPRLPGPNAAPAVQGVPAVANPDAIPVVAARPDRAGKGHRRIAEPPRTDFQVALLEREGAVRENQATDTVNGNERKEPPASATASPKEAVPKAEKLSSSAIVSSEEEARKAKSKKLEAKKERDRIRRMFAVRTEDAAIKMQQEMIRMSTPRVTVEYDPMGQFKGRLEVYPNGSSIRYDRNMTVSHMDIVMPDGTKISVGRENYWRGSW